VKRWVFPAGLLAILMLLPLGALASDVPVRLNLYNEGGVLTKQVKSLKEMRLRNMVPQSRDYSCGAAALATLMQYFYGLPTTEMDAIGGMFKYGDQDEIKKVGFSLLDMKRYANSMKYRADGFKVPKVETLKELKIPVIVLIDTGNYKHFVVVRRVDDTHVYVSDPSWGNRRLLHNEFAKIWNQNIIFAVEGPKVGTPEGLFEEKPLLASQISRQLRMEPVITTRFALDPADVILSITNTPLFVLPFIPGQ
jgi:predicted double-glycine peptidase